MRVVAATPLQDVVAQANRAILRARDQQELFAATCRIAVERGELRMAWIGQVNPAGRRVEPVASAGFTDGYLDGIRVTVGDEPEGHGPVGTAVAEGRMVVVDDIVSDPAFAPWRDAATSRGYRSAAALPLHDDGEVVGVLAVYADEPQAFDDRDVAVLRELADDVSFGLRMQRLDRERKEARRAEQEAAERLRQLDEMKSAFLAAVSHEIRTPLTGVLGFTQVLSQRYGQLPPQQARQLLDGLDRNVIRLRALLQDLLDVDRLTRDALVLSVLPVAMDALVMRTLDAVDAGGHAITTDLEPVVVEVDPPKVERIVENLLVNAVRHTAPETAVTVRVRSCDGGVLLTVADRGPGVPDEMKQRVFEPFQLGDTAAAKVGGTGIGLTMVARFADLHGGRTWVDDVEGGGAAFRVWLPADQAVTSPGGSHTPPG